jgi:RNA polymerase sigma factor (sigma-70 family)
MDSKELIELRQDKNKLKQMYKICKPKCFAFMAKCFGSQSMDDTNMFTVFNDAVIVLYEKLEDPDFKLTSSIQTYLNSVCRNMALEGFRKEQRLYKTTDRDIENLDYSDQVTDVLEEITNESPYEKAINKAFAVMRNKGGNCAEILTMFWYQKASMEEIASRFSYTNPANAKNQKAKCQKRLKDIALQFERN